MQEPISLIGAVRLDRNHSTPLHRQLYEALRQHILSGQLKAATKLPPTRSLAHDLGVSRNTIINAFDQLIAEGYLEGRAGSGTFVSAQLPESWLQINQQPINKSTSQPDIFLSQRGQRLAATQAYFGKVANAFPPGLPAIDAFPFALWEKLLRRYWQEPNPDWLGYNDPLGHLPLRQAIATHIQTARGVVCDPEQVVITSGTQEGMSMAARLLLDPGDEAWMENPGYKSAAAALVAAGAQVVPIELDDQGLLVSDGVAKAPDAKMVYVSPSHQYPLGSTMSLARRMELLEWAGKSGTWILEDDYNNEYRFGIRPIPALHALDQYNRVLYIGTFSKVMFPALRIGYIVVPKPLIAAFQNLKAFSSRAAPQITQMALADFITEGHFARHLRRMRTLYAYRRDVFMEEAQALAPQITFRPALAGMHVVGWLQKGVDDVEISAELSTLNIDAPPLSDYSLTPLEQGGLVFGFGAVGEADIRSNLRKIARWLKARR